MDATPTFRLCEFVCDDTMKAPPKSQKPSGGKFAEPKQLLFQYPDSFDTYVASALTRFDNDVFRHDHKVLASFNYGKNQIKKFAVSPDAFVQLSIQLAFYKLFGECRATYESAQTKKYAWGRTETCRSVSEDSVKFVKAAADPSVDPKIKANLARKAISTHTDFMAAAVDARGVDRHFLGMI
jgi:carnitine O-acetyltransferase